MKRRKLDKNKQALRKKINKWKYCNKKSKYFNKNK